MSKNLLSITKEYVAKKRDLDELQARYESIKADLTISPSVQGYSNQQSRDAALQKMLELDHTPLLTELRSLKADTRTLLLTREAIIETQKHERFMLALGKS